jgi:tetratricopeptide (TPR) repeat protein
MATSRRGRVLLMSIIAALAIVVALPAEAQEKPWETINRDGKKLVDQKKYGAALAKFEEGQRLYPSVVKFVHNAGYCLLRLGRFDEAVVAFEGFIALNPGEKLTAQARVFLEQAKAQRVKTMGKVTVETTPPGAHVELTSRPEGGKHSPASWWLKPGRHAVTARKEGYLVANDEVNATIGKPAVLRMNLQSFAQPTDNANPWPWVLTGVGGATVIAGSIVYGLAVSDFADADDYLDSTSDYNGYNSRYNDASGLGNVGRVSLGVGLAAVAGGLVWALVDQDGAESTATALHVVPHAGGAGLGITGRF